MNLRFTFFFKKIILKAIKIKTPMRKNILQKSVLFLLFFLFAGINTAHGYGTNRIDAMDSRGLSLFDDGANGIFIEDGGQVGIGTTSPSGNVHIYQASPDADQVLFQIGTSDEASRFTIDEDGDVTIGGDLTLTGTASFDWSSFVDAMTLDATTTIDMDTNSADLNFDSGTFYIDNTGVVGIGTISPDRLFHAEISDSATNAVTYGQRLSHITSGTPAAGIGLGIEFEQETADDNNEIIATIEGITTDVTDTDEDGALVFKTMNSGDPATEKLRIGEDNVRLTNGTWLRAVDNAGTGYVNMFKVNASDQIEVGGPLSVPSGLSMAEDSGVVTALDMPVSSSTTDGDEMSYTYRIDGTNILKVVALADGAGAVDTPQIIASPGAVAGSAAAPLFAFGDGDTGFYEVSDDSLLVTTGGTGRFYWTSNLFRSNVAGGAALLNEVASATNPVLSITGDDDTGIGSNAADQLSLISGGVEALRLIEDTDIEVRIAKNDSWVSSVDNAGTGTVNMFKVGTTDEIYVGGALNVGTIEATEDSGPITLVNMPVSATPSDGDEMSYSFMIDSDNILKVKASADSAGGVDEKQVIIAPGAVGNNASYPSLSFGDGDTGFYESLDDTVHYSVAGTDKFRITSSRIGSITNFSGVILSPAASATTPTFSFEGDENTGIGRAGADQVSIIAGGIEGVRVNTVASGVNYLSVTPSATTTPVILSAAGTDTNIGINLTPKGTGEVKIPNSTWFSAVDNAGTGTVNMFRVNTSDEVEVGANFNIGTIQLAEDSGVVGLVNLPVSATPADGTEESFTFGIDSTAVMKVKGSADSSGGADELQVIIPDAPNGTAALPSFAFGDGDTGLYETADDTLGLSLAGALKVSITSAGNIGHLIETGATTTGAITIDLDGGAVQTIALTGAVDSMATSNRSATIAKTVMVVFDANGGDRTFTSFNASWKWIGTVPASLPTGKKGVLTLISTDANETGIIASYEQVD